MGYFRRVETLVEGGDVIFLGFSILYRLLTIFFNLYRLKNNSPGFISFEGCFLVLAYMNVSVISSDLYATIWTFIYQTQLCYSVRSNYFYILGKHKFYFICIGNHVKEWLGQHTYNHGYIHILPVFINLC